MPVPIHDGVYAGHDDVYQLLQGQGQVGWDQNPEYEVMLDTVRSLLPAQSTPARLLEIGCGAGNLSVRLAREGHLVTGVDISRTAIEWAIRTSADSNPDVHFEIDNVVTLSSCRSGWFDAVIDGHCLHCIVGADRAVCLNSVFRVLRPGGTFIVLTMCGDVRNERILSNFDPVTGTVFQDGRPMRHIGTAESIISELEGAGFQIDAQRIGLRSDDSQQDDLIVRATKVI